MKVVITILVFTLVAIACKHKKDMAVLKDPAVQQIRIGQTMATVKLLERPYSNDSASGNKNEFCYFNVRFDNSITEQPTKEKTIYLDFDMQQDFMLVTGGDSIPAAFCERMANGKRGNYEYILAFGRKVQNDFEVIYNDKMFGMGIVGFAYKQSELKSHPL